MHIAILDDYFDAARHLADWSQLAGRADIRVFTEPLGGEDQAAKKLADFEIIVGMRERTPFPATLIRRLPKLKLLITTGMRNLSFDIGAAHSRGVMVCGTGGPRDSQARQRFADAAHRLRICGKPCQNVSGCHRGYHRLSRRQTGPGPEIGPVGPPIAKHAPTAIATMSRPGAHR